jgi:hypothetical protein
VHGGVAPRRAPARAQAYLQDAYSYWTQHVNMEGDFDLRYLVDWDNMIYPTTVLLSQLTDDRAFHTGAQSYFQKWLCRRAPFPPPLRALRPTEGHLQAASSGPAAGSMRACLMRRKGRRTWRGLHAMTRVRA